MYEFNKVLEGVSKYIDNEIISKITGWQKWVIGGAIGITLNNTTNVFNNLKQNELIKMLDIIDKEDKIDVDKIYIEMKKQAQKSAITFDVPMLGALTLNEKDVDKIYEFIKEDKSA